MSVLVGKLVANLNSICTQVQRRSFEVGYFVGAKRRGGFLVVGAEEEAITS